MDALDKLPSVIELFKLLFYFITHYVVDFALGFKLLISLKS